MTLHQQSALITPIFALQRAYLAVEQQPADVAEAQRLKRLRQLIEVAPDTTDLREFAGFAGLAREVMGEGVYYPLQ